VIHGLVYFADGSVVAQLADADMRTPISYALAWPDRLAWHGTPLDLTKLADLAFLPIDLQRFPCFGLARAALAAGGVMPAVLNAANEIAVAAFLDGHITFPAIANVVEACLDTPIDGDVDTLDAVLDIDRTARRHTVEHIARVSDFK
jgi:1-deoxy-D-xylulose-5-phosphate reductoisomerase